jgi:RNA polymerase-binding transcription factor DksA
MIMTTDQRFCERCGKEIPQRRLEVMPYTRLCLQCSDEIGGDFETYVVPEHTGKANSLKRNYGSWKVKRKLREITPKEKK